MEFDDIKLARGPNLPTPCNTQTPSCHPNHPLVFGFFIEYTYYPKSGRMYQSKCVPAGMKHKPSEAPKVKEEIKLKDASNVKPAWD